MLMISFVSKGCTYEDHIEEYVAVKK